MTKNKFLIGIISFALIIVFLIFLTEQMFVSLDSGQLMVIQYPNGTLFIATEPGIYPKYFGTDTKYLRREQFSFSKKADQGSALDESMQITFNDGGKASLSGVVSWEMPLIHEKILKIHKEFRNQKGIDQQLIRPTIDSAIFSTGPLMSSTESAGERRTELLEYINDQAQNGIYKKNRAEKTVVDPITGLEKKVIGNDILVKDGIIQRTALSSFVDLGIRLLPLSLNGIEYERKVQDQINKRQEQITEVQTAIAQAKKSEQQAITAIKQGEAAAAEAKWKQEVLKATAVTLAQQEKEVAELSIKTAEAKKRTLELEGEGEAAKRQAIMKADGGLDKKLDAAIKINLAYADAIKGYQGNWVPTTIMGSASNGNYNGAQTMIDLLTAKTSRELSLDMTITGNTKANTNTTSNSKK